MRLDNHVLSLNSFIQVSLPRTPQGLFASLFLYKRPIHGIEVSVSEKPIVLGAHGKLYFLSVAESYRIGYLIESVRAYTIIDTNFIFVGRQEEKQKKVKHVEVLHTDNHIHVIRCRSTHSHLIVPVCNLDFPKVVSLSNKIEEEE
jgi:hypothetical protein